MAPSDRDGARALSQDEVEAVGDAFVAAAVRAERAGFDGVSIHGGHGYLLAEFLSPENNRRDDQWGGSLENRSRLLFRIIDGIRELCGPDFQLGLRLSPERFGLRLTEMREVAAEAMRGGRLDVLDLSLWDVRKQPEEDEIKGRILLSYFTDLSRDGTRLSAAGKIMDAADARWCLENGADLIPLGRAGILAHDAPRRIEAHPAYVSPPLPVSTNYLHGQGLGDAFISYLRTFKTFVAD